VGFADEDNSRLSERIRVAVQPPIFKTARTVSLADINRGMDRGEYTFVINIPPGFQNDVLSGRRPVVRIDVDATATGHAKLGTNYLRHIITEETNRYLYGVQKLPGSPVQLNIRVKYNPNRESHWFMGIVFLMKMITLLSVLLPAAALIRERERGTVEHLLVMPLTPAEIIISKVWANSPINKEFKMANSLVSQEHSIIDLGEDEFTVGRLHPMMDNELRIRRLYEEAKNPEVAVIMLDVVIGYGSHPDPASEIAPAIKKCLDEAKKANRHLEIVCVVTGTDEDPQDINSQIKQLQDAGAWVDTSNEVVVRRIGRILRALAERNAEAMAATGKPVDLATLKKPMEAINVGLESFAENLKDQGAPYVHVEWKPPAGGNEKLMGILERMKAKS
jgi:hypothetical protein